MESGCLQHSFSNGKDQPPSPHPATASRLRSSFTVLNISKRYAIVLSGRRSRKMFSSQTSRSGRRHAPDCHHFDDYQPLNMTVALTQNSAAPWVFDLTL